ncbi:MAG: ATP-dependent DNA helicase RecG [Candidatus Aadella gelida]|nr:ATP-dependent DNA helicase RecG [Candidatus Aadella gelida]
MQVKKHLTDIPIRYMKGVGPKMASILTKVGIDNVLDLMYYLPRRYEDRSNIVAMKDISPGESQAFIGEVLKMNSFRARTGTVIFELFVGEGTKKVCAIWYNQPFMSKMFSKGQKVMLYGKVEKAGRLNITHPAFEILEEGQDEIPLEIGRIVPVYPLTESLTQKYIRKLIFHATKTYSKEVNDILPVQLRGRKKLVDSEFAVRNIHFPCSDKSLEKAYNRLVFEEFFMLQTIMAFRRRQIRKKGIKHEAHEGLLHSFGNLFDFELTNAQKKCIKDIEKDMSSERPMYRLLQGDVGSGKTVVAMYAALIASKGGYQTTVMVPTEILARQHYITFSKIFMPLGMNVRLLVNGMDQTLRDTIEKEISLGEADIVVGTHALIQDNIKYGKLGLVIVDEQHKFGVDQRQALRKKGKDPDMLVMTATPIPRSLVLTVFGDMDISSMKEKPAGRDQVSTYWVDEGKRDSVYSFIRGEVKEGRQAFIVYPRIKQTQNSELRSAEHMAQHLKEEIFPELNVALVHGRLKSDEKEKVMEDFRNKKYDVLVATTVIEVGVDIPNVTVMVVEHAERYGLAQLHQLRGRIGRGKYASYCILLGEVKTDASYERLVTMEKTSDGFEISRKDLEIRGPGEFLGTKQSGLPELRFGNIAKDFSIMEEAREEAFSLVEEDPGLERPGNIEFKKAIEERFGIKVIK